MLNETPASNKKAEVGTDVDKTWVLENLEQDQLVDQKRPVRRRKLSGMELAVIWALRIYLIFMLAAVVVQIMHSGGH